MAFKLGKDDQPTAPAAGATHSPAGASLPPVGGSPPLAGTPPPPHAGAPLPPARPHDGDPLERQHAFEGAGSVVTQPPAPLPKSPVAPAPAPVPMDGPQPGEPEWIRANPTAHEFYLPSPEQAAQEQERAQAANEAAGVIPPTDPDPPDPEAPIDQSGRSGKSGKGHSI